MSVWGNKFDEQTGDWDALGEDIDRMWEGFNPTEHPVGTSSDFLDTLENSEPFIVPHNAKYWRMCFLEYAESLSIFKEIFRPIVLSAEGEERILLGIKFLQIEQQQVLVQNILENQPNLIL